MSIVNSLSLNALYNAASDGEVAVNGTLTKILLILMPSSASSSSASSNSSEIVTYLVNYKNGLALLL